MKEIKINIIWDTPSKTKQNQVKQKEVSVKRREMKIAKII